VKNEHAYRKGIGASTNNRAVLPSMLHTIFIEPLIFIIIYIILNFTKFNLYLNENVVQNIFNDVVFSY